jgi:hypothetical protein
MTERKVVPITGKHTSLSSLMAECMTDQKAKRGIVIYFDDYNVMYPGHFAANRGDISMAAAWINMKAVDIMRVEDESK